MENLTHMAVFAEVVRNRSFSAAARQLGVSKSTVSKSVRQLEERLGAQLLNRTTRQLSLTEIGDAFYERCQKVVDEAQAAERAVTDLTDGARGTLRLNATMSFGMTHVAPAVADFLVDHPDISIDMTMTDEFVDLVREGYDLAIRIGNLPNSTLIARKLAACDFVLCAAPSYIADFGRPAQPRDLADHTCLRYAYHATGDVWKFNGPDGECAVRVNGPLRVNNGEALRAAAVAGLGVIFVPLFLVADDIDAGRLAPLLDGYGWTTNVFAVYPHSRHVSPKIRRFVDFIADRFRDTSELTANPRVDLVAVS